LEENEETKGKNHRLKELTKNKRREEAIKKRGGPRAGVWEKKMGAEGGGGRKTELPEKAMRDYINKGGKEK